jgi:hypothetical protein
MAVSIGCKNPVCFVRRSPGNFHSGFCRSAHFNGRYYTHVRRLLRCLFLLWKETRPLPGAR